jgi:CRISPR/Cas system CMR-associated protein Cmr1 (group 7 of RAMP superfamily)
VSCCTLAILMLLPSVIICRVEGGWNIGNYELFKVRTLKTSILRRVAIRPTSLKGALRVWCRVVKCYIG